MRVLRAAEHCINGAKDAGAISLEYIEGARSSETFQHALVDGARIDPSGKVGEVGERAVLPRRDDRLHGLLADTFERSERVDDRVAVDLEIDSRAVDRRRIDLDAEALCFRAEFGELVGIAHVERHGCRQELDRKIRLHVGGLIRDQRVSRRVAFVETVFGEAFEQIEDRVGLVAFNPVLYAASDEMLALILHLLADLLAHGAAEQIGLTRA